jgi:hypothetical protein
MALEINEIGIRMRVHDGAAAPASDGSAAPEESGGGDGGADRRDDIVNECVRRVLHALKAAQER